MFNKLRNTNNWRNNLVTVILTCMCGISTSISIARLRIFFKGNKVGIFINGTGDHIVEHRTYVRSVSRSILTCKCIYS